jgi:hypothetical protein
MKKIIFLILFSFYKIHAQVPVMEEGSFMPPIGQYIISGWVKETGGKQPVTYTQSSIQIQLGGIPAGPTLYKPSGLIIDGWQRIVGIVYITGKDAVGYESKDISIKLDCTNTLGDCYFDDIRFFPYNGNMKSFVYDEDTQRLMAELDENNYATFYEYDIEGGLIRVKKETEKGVFTIQETRSNSAKITR